MQNKSSKGWTDVQFIIGSISIALTLGFWSLFASREKVISGVSAAAEMPPQSDPAVAAPVTLLPGQKLLFAGAAPQAPSPIVTSTKRRHGGGGSGGAVTTTRSSRP